MKKLPRRYVVFAGASVIIVFFIVLLWPQQVTLSYQKATCVTYPVLAPSTFTVRSGEFEAAPLSELKVGSLSVAASGFCIRPLSAPRSGDYKLLVPVPGLPFISKALTIHVPSHPTASVKQLDKPIPIGKKLFIPLSTNKDTIFSYRLVIDDRVVACGSGDEGIVCDLKKMDLRQGSDYTLRLDRYFKDKKIATIIENKITTLSAVTLLSSSITQNETVFAKPTSMRLLFDKSVSAIDVALMKVDGSKNEDIVLNKVINDKEVQLSWTGELLRRQNFQVVLRAVEATDGSSLADSATIGFKTSGGPIVKNINIGTYKVALGAIATITFDQPLSEKQDISKIITATGGARVAKKDGSSVSISFAGVPRCGDVTIKISDDLMSSYEIAGGTSWQYATRTICQTVSTIGTSVQGRAITSYSFGNGAKKVVYTGAIHGDEVSTRSLMLRWIDIVEANARSIPSDKTIIVIPTINPDGFAAGTRTNVQNVDLNRNFNTSDWKKDITSVSNQPFPGGGGTSPLSEPESRALANYISATRPTLVVSYHSIGGLVMANQSGGSLQLAQTYSRLSGYLQSTGSSTTFDYSVSGTADDYYAEILGVPSILIELGSHTYYQIERNQQAMWAVLRET